MLFSKFQHNIQDEQPLQLGYKSKFKYLIPNRECFSSYTTNDYGVRWGIDMACRIVGIGNVCLLTSTCCRMVLNVVCHVLDIRLNLILVGQLNDEGYSGSFRNGSWKFYKRNLIVARAKKQNTFYVLHARLCQNEIMS